MVVVVQVGEGGREGEGEGAMVGDQTGKQGAGGKKQ